MINKHEQLVKIMLNSKSENTFFFIYNISFNNLNTTQHIRHVYIVTCKLSLVL